MSLSMKTSGLLEIHGNDTNFTKLMQLIKSNPSML